jgi:hypothetical protein
VIPDPAGTLERLRAYFADRSDASMEPGDTHFHGNEEMALLGDVEAVTAEIRRLSDGMPRWIPVSERLPEMTTRWEDPRYVLAVDAKGRMSVGYYVEHSSGKPWWTFAKAISDPTHWQPLPAAPEAA